MDDKGTLATRAFFSRKSDTRRKEIPVRIIILVAALAFLVPITVSVFAGAFETEKGRVYVVPKDIKGSTSFSESIDDYSVSRDQLFNCLEIPESASVELKIKDLTGIPGLLVKKKSFLESTLHSWLKDTAIPSLHWPPRQSRFHRASLTRRVLRS
ncbi:hypothetical protein [Mesotoga sp.]|uniref:hypothetical protein n=1 Tax=Mesotoga sp. TaxID=2053577 RepID=UPI00345E8EDE